MIDEILDTSKLKLTPIGEISLSRILSSYKEIRYELDCLLPPSRYRSLVSTSLEEAQHWLLAGLADRAKELADREKERSSQP
jgi:hypothetical protein